MSACRSSQALRNGRRWIRRDECGNHLLYLFGNRFRFRHTRPGGVNSIEQPIRDRRPFEHLEVFLAGAALGRTAHALALVHAHARSGDLGERLAQKRTEPAGFDDRQASRVERKLRFEKKNGDVFQTRRTGFQIST